MLYMPLGGSLDTPDMAERRSGKLLEAGHTCSKIESYIDKLGTTATVLQY